MAYNVAVGEKRLKAFVLWCCLFFALLEKASGYQLELREIVQNDLGVDAMNNYKPLPTG